MPTIDKSERLKAKKAAFQTGHAKGKKPLWITFLCAGLLAGGLISYFLIHSSGNAGAGKAPVAGASSGQLVMPVSTFEDGKAHFYTQKEGKVEIRYFVLKSSDSVLRVAFDACDVCWPAGKGYAQNGDTMVCRNCGLRFPSVKVNEVRGGCNPAPITRKVEGGNLIIQAEDLRQGSGYFDFARRG